VQGDTFSDLIRIAAFDPCNRALRETVENWYGLSASIPRVVAALPAIAGTPPEAGARRRGLTPDVRAEGFGVANKESAQVR
jgi:hypothetical protein